MSPPPDGPRPVALLLSALLVSGGCTLEFDTSRVAVDGGSDTGSPGECRVMLRDERSAERGPDAGSPPPEGELFRDPVYGTCIERLTPLDRPDRQLIPVTGPFNADGTFFLVNDSYSEGRVYDARTRAPTPYGYGNYTEHGVWHPTDPNRLRFLPSSRLGVVVERHLVRGTHEDTDLWDFSSELASAFPGADVVEMVHGGWTSTDHTRLAFSFSTGDGSGGGLMTFRVEGESLVLAGTVGPSDVGASGGPEWSLVAPSGRAVASCWPDAGIRIHDHALSEFVAPDPGVRCDYTRAVVPLRDGNEAFVYQTDSVFYALDIDASLEADAPVRYALDPDFGHTIETFAYATFAVAPDKPGWVLIRFDSCLFLDSREDCPPGTAWGQDRIMAFEVPTASATDPPRVLPLAWHQDLAGVNEASIGVDPTLTRVLFSSTWGAEGGIGLFEMDLAGSIPD